jgi:hypothetical protein
MKLLTKSELREKIISDRKVLVKAILALNEYQTRDEQKEERAKYQNNVGFKSCHASKGSGMAKFYQNHGFLTEKQMGWWLRGYNGKPRILNYLNQLHRIHVKKYIQVTGEKNAEKV